MSTPSPSPRSPAVLQYLLNLVFNDPSTGLGSVTVSAVAPDIVQNAPSGNGDYNSS